MTHIHVSDLLGSTLNSELTSSMETLLAGEGEFQVDECSAVWGKNFGLMAQADYHPLLVCPRSLCPGPRISKFNLELFLVIKEGEYLVHHI